MTPFAIRPADAPRPLAVTTGRLKRPDGAEIAYEVSGAGKALVLAHGLGGNATSWWQTAPVFAATHRVVAFSHRGFPPSSAPGVPDPRLYAADLLALLDHLGIEQAVIVGQSMGGWTCVETALAAPDRVAGLVMACTTGSFDYDHFDDPGVKAWRVGAPAAIETLAARHVHRAAGARMADEQPMLHELYRAIDRLGASVDKDAVGKAIRAMRNRTAKDAERLTCPMLYITGEEDLLICPRGVELVSDTCPDARLITVPRAGHSVYFEHAGLFNEALAGFLAEIDWR